MNYTNLKITDFGAVPGDTSCDCAPAVQCALESAKKLGGAIIEFPKGDYYFGSTPISDERAVIPVYNAENIVLSGGGSKIIVGTPFAGVFAMRECKNITLRGFEIEYTIPPWTQGKVIKADKEGGEFDYISDEGYDVFSLPGYGDCSVAWGIVENPDNRHMLRPDAPEHFILEKIQPVGERTYRLTPQNRALVSDGVIREGDRIVYTCRNMTGSVCAAFMSENVTVEDMLVHECGDCLFVAAYIDGRAVIRNYRTAFRGKNDIVSVADGVHIQGSRASVLIENCHFEGLLDDCVNLYQMSGRITAIADKISLYHPEGNIPKKGETVMFYDPLSQCEKLRTVVKSVEKTGEGRCDIEIADDASSLFPDDTFCILECMAPGSKILNNVFRYSRRYGLLLKSRDTKVCGNLFENLGADAVNFAANVSDFHKEGPHSENVLIENNRIVNVCYRNGRKYKNRWASGACIGIYKNNKNIRIFKNEFINPPAYTVSYGSEEEGIHIK